MKNLMKSIKLYHLPTISLIICIVAVLSIPITNHYWIAILILIIDFAMLTTFFKCPHCGKRLDTRMNIQKNIGSVTTYC